MRTGLIERLRRTAFWERYSTDIRFKYRVSLHVGLTVNLAYIVIKLIYGVYFGSMWFVALAVYYTLLALTRLFLIRYRRENDMEGELRVYRSCGYVLLIINQALTGIVIFMVRDGRAFDYPGVLIYAMAAYSFYAVTVAVINIVKTRKHNSPILSAAKAVDLVAATVSILSLETALLARFGGEDDPMFHKVMTGATGGGVCAVVIAMAIYMIARSSREIKNLKINNSQT